MHGEQVVFGLGGFDSPVANIVDLLYHGVDVGTSGYVFKVTITYLVGMGVKEQLVWVALLVFVYNRPAVVVEFDGDGLAGLGGDDVD